MKYPRQIPVPTAWLKAFILSAFVFTAEEAETSNFNSQNNNFDASWVNNWANDNPEAAIFAVVLIILSPIAIVAIFHYLMHLLLGAFSPQLQCDRVQKQPVLMSLWEGVYAWLILFVATLVMIALWSASANDLSMYASVPIAIKLTWIATAAYLYHLEYSTRQK
ncbi:hypothetical protein H6F67_10935 [Microcoleus sp. FACHB-1515]|uniref:hypothetical protein n=1 Tax=Cyanophyceae TaxID=3028117 RepID=UPI0016837054|nr:hypothetical protein [Microcoleus sp. FACHB-1515]MBD2090369.1 hypothetical protein [Microcoleus sp. FACHB-1515]